MNEFKPISTLANDAQVFIEAANAVAEKDQYSCNVVCCGGRNGFALADRYAAAFAPENPRVSWLNEEWHGHNGHGIPENQQQDIRVLMLCFAAAMAMTNDI